MFCNRFEFRSISLLAMALTAFVAVSGAQISPGDAHAISAKDVSGVWAVSWDGRLGTEHCTLKLRQAGKTIAGTFDDGRRVSTVSGAADGNQVSLDVLFGGTRPYTVRFTGSAEGEKIAGTSRAVEIGGSGAYLGHGGEIVQPEHPWTAQRSSGGN